jgi:hypothetical protein
MQAPDFKSKLVRTRRELLLEIITAKKRKGRVVSPANNLSPPRPRFETDPQPGRMAISAMSESGNS